VLNGSNPNCIVFWHFTCLAIAVEFSTLELAAGRDGEEKAKEGLDLLASWAQTPSARRACLHAAEIFKAMSNRQTMDGTSFLTEVALFYACLTLGLYLFTLNADAEDNEQDLSTQEDGADDFDIIEDVDWVSIRSLGLNFEDEDATIPLNHEVKRFVRSGRDFRFHDLVEQANDVSAQRVFLSYASLLQETGRWNPQQYC